MVFSEIACLHVKVIICVISFSKLNTKSYGHIIETLHIKVQWDIKISLCLGKTYANMHTCTRMALYLLLLRSNIHTLWNCTLYLTNILGCACKARYVPLQVIDLHVKYHYFTMCILQDTDINQEPRQTNRQTSTNTIVPSGFTKQGTNKERMI